MFLTFSDEAELLFMAHLSATSQLLQTCTHKRLRELQLTKLKLQKMHLFNLSN